MGTVEHLLEEFPRIAGLGCPDPDVGGVFTAVAFKTKAAKRLKHLFGVLHIIGNGSLDLLFAIGGVCGFCGTLGNIAGAVELRALATVP